MSFPLVARRVRPILRQRNVLRWGGALTVGLAAVSCRSIFTGRSTVQVNRLTHHFRTLPSSIQSFMYSTTLPVHTLRPPQPAPIWTHTPDQVQQLAEGAIDKYKAILDRVGSLDEKDCTYESVFLALVDAGTDDITSSLCFYQHVSSSPELRAASNAAESLLLNFGVESSMRIDVYNAKVAAEKNMKANGQWEKLSGEEQKLVDEMILDGTRSGLALPENKRIELMALQKELSQTCLEFGKNFSEEKATISFSKKELEGVPRDIISGYAKRQDGEVELYDITYKTPDILPVFKFATNPETRRRAYEGHESRLSINAPLLSRALDLRRQIASLLGYENWAAYVLETKMAKSHANVSTFLTDLEAKLIPVGIKDREALLAVKKREHEELGIPFDGELYAWDYRYFDRKFVEQTLDLDDSLVKEYFPVTAVIPTIMGIYQDLLSVRFEEVKDGSIWHPDVQMYSVWEKEAAEGSGFVGYCYLDLFPRDNKYSHAAVWPLISGYEKPDGSRNYPIAAMVANLAKSTPEKPALMRHDDVVTFFHEMGHVFHGLLSKTKFSRFHGTSVARDFVEAPSQMLENWCWEPEILQRMSSHYQTSEPLSDELIQKLIKSRYVNVGMQYLRQIFFAKFDIKVHTDKEATDYTHLWNSMRESISLIKSGKYHPGQGSFAHITGGYDAGYYGYLYSLVFAADMYSTIFKGNPLDPALGQLYRDKVLKYGGSREELDTLKDFLGREPDSNAFVNEIFK